MKKNIPKYLLLLILGASLLLCSAFPPQVIAQSKDTPDSVRFNTLGCLYRAIQALNNRNVRFKAMQEELENMRPLEPQSMDSVHFANNLIKVSKYLLFLESHRKQITRNTKVLSDSIQKFEALMGSEEEKKSLNSFLVAYKEESAAFIGYSQRLSLLLTDIRTALFYLETVPMERKGNDITFNTDRSANEKYLDFENMITAGQMQVDNAIAKMIKLTEKENKAIQQSITLLNK